MEGVASSDLLRGDDELLFWWNGALVLSVFNGWRKYTCAALLLAERLPVPDPVHLNSGQ